MNDKNNQEKTQKSEKLNTQVGEEEVLENKLNSEGEDEHCELSEIREELVAIAEEDATEEITEEEEVREDDTSPSTLDKLIIKELPGKISDYCFNLFKSKQVHLIIDKDPYFLNFKPKGLEVLKKDAKEIAGAKPNLTVEVASDIFFKIIKRKLNPQVALLNCQVKVKGDESLAIYFFNLFARSR